MFDNGRLIGDVAGMERGRDAARRPIARSLAAVSLIGDAAPRAQRDLARALLDKPMRGGQSEAADATKHEMHAFRIDACMARRGAIEHRVLAGRRAASRRSCRYGRNPASGGTR